MRESTDRDDRGHDLGAVVSLLEILADLDGVGEESAPLPEGGLAEARAAAARLLRGDGGPAPVSMSFTEIETWLSESALEAATVRGAVTAPTLDRHEPGLVAYGYQPDIEIDADVDPEAATAVVTVVVEPIDDRAQPLVLSVRTAAGVTRTAPVNAYGMVVIDNLPITARSPNDLRFEWSSGRAG